MTGATPGSAILARGLSTAFGEQQVLRGIDLSLALGETLVVLGRSGTGKSVLLRHLIGLRPPDRGSIQVLGQTLAGLAEPALNQLRKRLGFVFQNAALYDSMTVLENVEFPFRHHTRLSPGQRQDQARALLARVGLEAAAGKLPTAISGGMRKRVGLARALALDPELMLYDEPTTGLDPITARDITELMLTLQQERRLAAVVVTHDLIAAQALAGRVALLEAGRIVFEGTFAALQAAKDPFVARFVGLG